jgi:hypothetical protein
MQIRHAVFPPATRRARTEARGLARCVAGGSR